MSKKHNRPTTNDAGGVNYGSPSLSASPFPGSPSNPGFRRSDSTSSFVSHAHPSTSVGQSQSNNTQNNSGNSSDTMSYQEQIANINNINSGNIDYKTISKHLVSQEDSLKRQGGDISRYIYQQIENANNKHGNGEAGSPGDLHPISSSATSHLPARDVRRTRSSSFSTYLSNSRRESTASDINIPGGFRREFIINKSLQQNQTPPNFLTSNFVEFLSIYGHFAGEDFSDDENEDDEFSEDDERYEDVFDEESSLLANDRRQPQGHVPKARKKKSKQPAKGTASVMKTFFLLFKSLVGSGVLFLPRAFCNGGLLFSTITLSAFGVLTFLCYVALIRSKKIINKSSFGELGFKTYGKPLKLSILISILISQIGFVSTYILFTAQNLTSFLENVFGFTNVNTANIVIAQCILLIPLVLIRNLTKLSLVSLISSAFIVIGLVIIFYFSGLQLLHEGLGPNIVKFDSSRWSMLIGVAVTSFEGIGLILPIESSMAHPEKFTFVLSISMLLITTLFVSIGVIGYSAFGDQVKSIIILNLPQNDFSVQSILVLYSMAVFLSAPLQIFPAIKIGESIIFNSWLFNPNKQSSRSGDADDDEGKLYHNSGKYNNKVKWLKNVFRAFAVVSICTIAYLNADNIDRFVSFNGCFACIPLVYIYPPLIHLKTYTLKKQDDLESRLFKIFDYILIVVGFVAVFYTTYQVLFMN